MALGDPLLDPALAAQLYGAQDPALAGMPQPDPWSWVPPHWNDAPLEQLPPQTPVTTAPPAEFPPPVDASLAGNPALPLPEPPTQQATVRDLPGFTVGYEPPVALPPPVDAISGGPPPTRSTPTPGQQFAEQAATDPMSIADPALRQRVLNELAQRDPQKFAEVMVRHEDDRKKFAAARRAETLNRDYDEQIANLKARQAADQITQQKTQELLVDSQRLASIGIDPSGGVKGARRIAGVLQSILGGLIQGKAGSARNAGLDAFVDTVNRGIEAQKLDLENQRANIGLKRTLFAEEFARHGDAFHAAEALRQASYKHADDLLAAEQQNFDPQGTQALKIATMRAGIAGEQQKGVQAYQQKRFENELKLQDAARQQQIADETARHNRQQLGLGYAQLDSAKEDRRLARDQIRSDKTVEREDKEAERVRQFSVSSPRPALVLDDKGKPVIGPDGKPQTAPARFVNKNGKPWLLGDAESTRAMKDKIAAASEITDMIDEVLDIREKVGGESTILNSDASQRLKLLQERMRLVRKSGTYGMSSDKDFEALGASIGADDLTSFRAKSAGLKEARERTTSELNTQMKTHNYDGPPVAFANRYVGATNTPEDDRRKSLLKAPGGSLDDAIRQNLDKTTAARGYGIDTSDPADQELYQRVVAETRASFEPGAAAGQASDIAALGKAAAGGDPAARAVLQEVATKAGTPRLRELAKSELEALAPKPTPRGPESAGVTVPDELRLQ